MKTAIRTLLFFGTAGLVGAGTSMAIGEIRAGWSIDLPFDAALLTPFGSLLPGRGALEEVVASPPKGLSVARATGVIRSVPAPADEAGLSDLAEVAAIAGLPGRDVDLQETSGPELRPFTRLSENFPEIASEAMLRIGYVPKGVSVMHAETQARLQAATRPARLDPADVLVSDSATLLTPGSAFRLHGVTAPEVADLCVGEGGAPFSCRDWATEGLRILVSQSLSLRCTPAGMPGDLPGRGATPAGLPIDGGVAADWGHVEGGDLALEDLQVTDAEAARDPDALDAEFLAFLEQAPSAIPAHCSANLGGDWIDLAEWTVSMGLNAASREPGIGMNPVLPAGPEAAPEGGPGRPELRQLESSAMSGAFGLWSAGWRQASPGEADAPSDPDLPFLRSGHPI